MVKLVNLPLLLPTKYGLQKRSLDLEHKEQVKPLRTELIFLKRQLYVSGGEGGSVGVVMAAASGT